MTPLPPLSFVRKEVISVAHAVPSALQLSSCVGEKKKISAVYSVCFHSDFNVH